MIRFENVYDTAKKAYDKNELYEFLCGKNDYDLPVLDAPTNIPTDWTVIIPNGIYKLYKNNIGDQEKIKNDFVVALKRMINGESTEIWEAAYIIFILLKSQSRNVAPFNIDETLVDMFSNRVDECKSQLSENKEYDGAQFSNGLLGDIERLNSILNSKYSVRMVR